MTGSLGMVGTGDQVPVGLLTWAGWQVLRDADQVLAREGLDPRWEQSLAEAGVPLTLVAPRPVERLAGALVSDAASGEAVVWFVSRDGDPGLGEALTRELVRRSSAGEEVPEVEMVLGSWDEAGSDIGSEVGLEVGSEVGSQLVELVRVMDRLRSPGGCPWDAEQTHASLLPYLLEESFELAEAVESGDRVHLREELGDVLLQVVFHARVAAEDPDDPFDVDDVAAGIVAKLVRRHPHVFADASAETAADVEVGWERIKREEKGRESVMDGVPVALPALARAAKVLDRLDRTTLPVGRRPAVPQTTLPDDLGGHLLGLVSAARAGGVDAEAALRHAVRALEHDVRAEEADQAGSG